MAEGKKSFVLYVDLIHTTDKLSDEQAGRLFKHILGYVNDLNPEPCDFITELAFEPVKQQLKRDLKRYEQKQTQRIEAGKRSAEQRKLNEVQRNSTTVNDSQHPSTVNVDVDVNVDGNVNVNDNVLSKDNNIKGERKEIITPDFSVCDWQIHIDKMQDVLLSDIIWVEDIARFYKLGADSQTSISNAEAWIKRYVESQKAENVKFKPKSDVFSHCKRWIGTQLKPTPKEIQNGKTVFRA